MTGPYVVRHLEPCGRCGGSGKRVSPAPPDMPSYHSERLPCECQRGGGVSMSAGQQMRFDCGDRITVRFTDVGGSKTGALDMDHDGQEAEVVKVVTRALHNGYGVRFNDGHETYIYEHEAVAS